MKIAAGICTYSSAQGLDRCLKSLQALDQIIVIHGPYPNFDPLDKSSINDTKAVCEQYSKNNTRLIDISAPTSEIERRQKYLGLAKDYDFLIVIDSDEYVCGEWDAFIQFCQSIINQNNNNNINQSSSSLYYIYDILHGTTIETLSPRPRLFRNPSKIKYYQKHYWWQIQDTGQIIDGSSDSRIVADGIYIIHDSTLRKEGYTKAKQQYQNWLREHESQYIIHHNRRRC